tara:strand:+ start:121 stop:906 length:786 start_codon:yes stop_codon:yes gene_type:complete
MSLTDEGHYGPKQLNLLEVVWGEGFLSPGGTEEIDEIVKNTNLEGKSVLDIGCGCGGAAFHLIKKYKAKSVQGIDTEPLVIKTAQQLSIKNNLADKTTFKCVEPGPLKYNEETFDVIFSKEVFLHIPDKKALLKDVHRILKPGGLIIVSDWMRMDDNPPSKQMQDYIAAEGLDMLMCSLKKYKELLEFTNFTNIEIRDRNEWYLQKAKKELTEIEGPLYQKVVDVLGVEETLGAIEIWRKLIGVLEIGEHRPGHFKGIKVK